MNNKAKNKAKNKPRHNNEGKKMNNDNNNLNLSLTFGRGEVHICMPALAVKVEPSPSTGKAVRVWISLNKTRPGESPIEIAVFPSPESFLEQFSDWIRRYRAPTPEQGDQGGGGAVQGEERDG